MYKEAPTPVSVVLLAELSAGRSAKPSSSHSTKSPGEPESLPIGEREEIAVGRPANTARDTTPRRFVWLVRKPSGHTFRPQRNDSAHRVKRCMERLTGVSWRQLWAEGYRLERVPVRARRQRPRLVA